MTLTSSPGQPPWTSLVLPALCPWISIWPETDEHHLAWDPVELSIYMNPAYGDDQRLLLPHDKAPTALHSWGHVARDCPCGCRPAFSDKRLRSGGARGFGLLSSVTGRHRHLHPQEGALLCTVPPCFQFPIPPRAALCLLGQIAAPLQVLWLQSHILAGLQQQHWGWTHIDPLACIRVFQDYLTSYVKASWITLGMYQPRSIWLHIEGEGQITEIKVHQPVTAQALANAEKELCGWGHYAIIKHMDQRLPPNAYLQSDILYTIELRRSKHVLPFSNYVPITGGGTELSQQCLGDQIIWRFMRALRDHATVGLNMLMPFMLYPFRGRQLMRLSIPIQFQEDTKSIYHNTDGRVFLICELNDHWILLVGEPVMQNGLSWTLYDGLRQGQLHEPGLQVATKITNLLGKNFVGLHLGDGLLQRHQTSCGTIALLQLAIELGLLSTAEEDEVTSIHHWLLGLQTEGHLFAGGATDVQKQLADLLTSKGVSEQRGAERAQQAISRLGLTTVQSILKAKNPWADLKAAASRPGMMFRLLTQEEQNQYITARAQTKHGAQIKDHKQKKMSRSAAKPGPVCLDPDQFTLDSSHFQDEQEVPVEQIQFSEVRSDQRGVALCTTTMAQEFLQQPKSISIDALALLLIDTPAQELIDKANLDKIIIPAKCQGTNEHTLIFGHILQLGDCTVTRSHVGKGSCPDVIETRVLKLQIFKDQLQVNWQDFCAAPIRALVAKMEALQLCRGQQCGTDCAKFHPGLDEQVDNVIFEIWSRTFFNEQGHKTTAAEASLFTAFMRVPDGALHRILSTTPDGVYAEPRGALPREHDERYCVIWLPGASYEDAQHQCRTFSKSVCLVRMRQKYGIRVLKSDEKIAWTHLRPGIDYVDLDIQHIWELFPLPHGTQKQAMVRLLKDWEWHARPLQPGRGNYQHMSWRVGSQQPPPHPIMKGFQMDVMISQIKDLKMATPQPHLIATSKTKKHLSTATSSSAKPAQSTDPWMETGKDPWGTYKPRGGAATASDPRPRLEELKSQLSTDLRKDLDQHAQAAVQAAATSSGSWTSPHEDRIQALEVGLQEIKGQNAQFHTWFQQAGERMQSTENAVSAVQHTLNSHQHELHALGSTFQSTMKNIKNDFSAEMTDSFNQQLSRLEALLEKKQRSS